MCLGLTCVVSGTPSKNPTMATDSVTTVLFLMIQSVPISSTMAVTRVSSRQNYKNRGERFQDLIIREMKLDSCCTNLVAES